MTDVSTTSAEVIMDKLVMTSTQVVKTSVNVASNSVSEFSNAQPGDHTSFTFDLTPGFKPFRII